MQVWDLPISGCPVRLVWRKRRWLCGDPDCEARSFTEQSELVKGSLTTRAARETWRRVGEDGHSVAQVAREFGTSWTAAMQAVRRHGRPLVDDPGRLDGVQSLGVDEHKMLSANRTRNTFYATSFVDLERGRLLDVVPGRNADDVAYWLFGATPVWKAAVRTVAIDPHRGYANGLLRGLHEAVVTIDHFHAVKLANEAINDVRRRVQNETLGHRGLDLETPQSAAVGKKNETGTILRRDVLGGSSTSTRSPPERADPRCRGPRAIAPTVAGRVARRHSRRPVSRPHGEPPSCSPAPHGCLGPTLTTRIELLDPSGPVRLASWRRRFWAPAVRSAGLTPLRAHDLRHTAVAPSLRSGTDLVLVAELAGHRSLETTRSYALPTAADRQAAVELAGVDP